LIIHLIGQRGVYKGNYTHTENKTTVQGRHLDPLRGQLRQRLGALDSTRQASSRAS